MYKWIFQWDIRIKSMRIARHERIQQKCHKQKKNMNIEYIQLVESHTKKMLTEARNGGIRKIAIELKIINGWHYFRQAVREHSHQHHK